MIQINPPTNNEPQQTKTKTDSKSIYYKIAKIFLGAIEHLANIKSISRPLHYSVL